MKFYVTALLCWLGFSAFAQQEITVQELTNHIQFLASDEEEGRFPGTIANEDVALYIDMDFQQSGLMAFEGNYLQEFNATLRKSGDEVSTWNIVGFIPGNDAKLKNEFIVLGAHYDHLGKVSDSIFHGADDNASGTAALLEIAEKVAAHQSELKRSVIFIAFGAEEQGLLGSTYFTENPPVPLSTIKVMLNMDMVGRLNEQKQVYMGGAASFPGGEALMKSLGAPNGINPIVIAYDVGGSDHVSFFKKEISVLGLHTGGHEDYHKPTDTADKINYEGEVKVCNYIYDALMHLATTTDALYFIPEEKEQTEN